MSPNSVKNKKAKSNNARFFFIAVSLVAFVFMILMLSVATTPEEKQAVDDSRSNIIFDKAQNTTHTIE